MTTDCRSPLKHPRSFIVLSCCVLVLLSVTLASAQPAAPLCPARSLLSIARAGSACALMKTGQACYGSGTVTSTTIEGSASAGLTQPGDMVALRELQSVRVVSAASADDTTISIASLAIPVSPRASDIMNVILLQDAELMSEGIPPVEVVVRATGALHVRSTPSSDSASIADFAVNNSLTANGRTRQGDWLRVTVPATGEIGWISAGLVSADGNLLTLPEAAPGDAIVQPFRSVVFTSSDYTACEGKLPSGALLQTPSTDFKDAVTLAINGDVRDVIRLAGTAFMTESNGEMTLTVLDGWAKIEILTAEQFVPAGAQIQVNSDSISPPAPYDADGIAALPTNNLPRRFQVTPPQTQAAIDAAIAAIILPTQTPILPTATSVDVCRRTIGRDTTVSSGPGIEYEALTTLAAGTTIRPVQKTTNAAGEVWWQLADSGWVVRSAVVERGNCPEIPAAGRLPAPPTNTYSLERCQSSNGPVRVGQQVTFEFIPPAWDNLGEAMSALQTDPGHFTLNADRFRARASQPIRLGTNNPPNEDRYLRRFTLVWRAQAGTFRITGTWLHYEPSCNLTVAAE
ncbi:MAG: SH3 domain-containing protein [Chloroflexi bacterium]|nr:SH3 domain-containing protein [Chloroflexota bacterium]